MAMRPIPAIAAQQCGVFSVHQALAQGWTRSALLHAIRSGRLRHIRAGAYQVADLTELSDLTDLAEALDLPSDRFERARWRHAAPGIAAALTVSGAAATHSTAAVLTGLPLVSLPRRACVTVPASYSGDLVGVHLHRTGTPGHLGTVGEVRTPCVERSIVDLSRELGTVAGVVALDHALHTGMTDLARLSAALEQCRGWSGMSRARAAVALADGYSESVLESRSRLAMSGIGARAVSGTRSTAGAGFPMPELQVPIGNAWGGFVGRVDFYWDRYGVVGEADGQDKYRPRREQRSSPLADEKRRQERLADLGLIVVRWGDAHLNRFETVIDRLERAFTRGQARPNTDRQWRLLPAVASSARPRIDRHDTHRDEVGDVARRHRQSVHERSSPDQRVALRAGIGHVQRRRPACHLDVDRQDAVAVPGQDAILEPRAEAATLILVPTLHQQNPGFEFADRHHTEEDVAGTQRARPRHDAVIRGPLAQLTDDVRVEHEAHSSATRPGSRKVTGSNSTSESMTSESRTVPAPTRRS